MRARLTRLRRWLYRRLAGRRLMQALERQHRAADELDRAVQEVLHG